MGTHAERGTIAARLLPFLLLGPLVVVGSGSAGAQEGDVRLTVLRQTPWVEVADPAVTLEVLARNDGAAALGDLSVRVTTYAPAFSRSDLELALAAEPGDPTVIRSEDVAVDGTLEPGAERAVSATVSLSAEGLNREQSYVYPFHVELLTGATSAAIVRSAIVVIVRDPVYPLGIQTGVQLGAPLLRGQDGTYTDPSLERAVAADGRIATAVAGLIDGVERRRPARVDIAIAPMLLQQLEDMADGYRVVDGGSQRQVARGEGGAAAAEQVLGELERLAASPSVRIAAPTLAGATLPSLRGPLARDLGPQLEIGAGVIERILGVAPSQRVMVPRRSAIDAGSLDRIAGRGAEVVLLTPLAVPPAAQPSDLSPPPTARLPGGRDGVSAVVGTQSLQNLVTSDTAGDDPVLAAQQTLAMTATVWLEQPGIDGRAVSVLLPESASGALVASLATRFASAPFLRPLTAGELVARVPPSERESGFAELDERGFGSAYVDAIRTTRRRIETYRSMLAGVSPLPDQLTDRVLLSEAAEFLDDPAAGLALLAAVQERADVAMSAVRPGISPVVTLTSRNGRIPLTVSNAGTETLSVRVGLESPQLETAAERDVNDLEPGETRDLAFDVRLKTTGQFPLRVVVRAPAGRAVAEETVIVRSTAYSRIALVITVGAALVLVLLWVRRFFRRTTS